MDPYEAQAGKIPPTDLYYDLPLYGRYSPSPQDFKPREEYCSSNNNTKEALQYWTEVLNKCDSTCYVYQNPFGGRDVFALGSIIIKSCHLGDARSETSRDYSIADKNEVAAIQLVPNTVPVPRILFSGKIKGNDVIIQERIPGVGLNVAWPYLSPTQKASFKKQTREIIHELSTVKPPPTVQEPTYIVSDPNPVTNRDIQPSENEILFNRSSKRATQLGFMHNDLQPSNIIVHNNQIFHRDDVSAVHSQFRTPRREDFAGVQLSAEELDDLEYWGDLYDFEHSDG
ncbi:kinase-like domain-containing protein [Trichoderma austrokoningii]